MWSLLLCSTQTGIVVALVKGRNLCALPFASEVCEPEGQQSKNLQDPTPASTASYDDDAYAEAVKQNRF